jgi:glyoxylase-like metal-dependent hydrolase (beta-lactamase superfamily II)
MSAPMGKTSPFPIDAWPTETFFTKQKVMYLNGEGIQVIAMPAAHTDADSIVYFRRSDVIAAGNIIDTRHFPVIDLENGGTIQGEIDSLNRLVEMAIPSIPLVNQEGGTFVVPGHGRICDQGDLVEYRDMVVIIRDVVRDMIRQGMTLEQIQRSSPTSGYSTRYGSDSGPWTTNQFVEAIYRSLKEKK